ncbi:3-oxoacyl-[acyl-carrier-protein] reductase [Sulfuriroseicoccus oceanibius]|uniref:3-oxoacyl-[acyl-carrier-protein] reductase n=1 Tax=Sulfuriroseicoccus oceanibius TaxID=2707525 RepID=A0A6B3L9P1_9BACT|nr:3-oxoacyl-[acyl-carrier-protein] reductase [Sulfuriroseicoccus oceanibius]QQL44361.1 3-oxoacyl-[acyl-carrier-protein] reductase [Sulfuriroseicoccus oceanibius]
MQCLKDRIAVVTGAGRGIGETIARTLAAAGAKVAVVSRTEANSAKVADAINAEFPGAAKPYAVDVADFAATQEAGKQILADFGGIDIIVNNAGITRDGLFLRMKEDDWDTVLDVNLKGAFNTVKAFSKQILRSKAGRIINISSVIGLMGNAGQTNYAASKAGLIGMNKSLAREFASRGVTANTICPGFIVTDMTDELTEDMQNQIKSGIPLASFGQTEDIANTVRFLASDEARYITGQTIAVDGGMTM